LRGFSKPKCSPAANSPSTPPPWPEFFSVFAVITHEGQAFSKYAPGTALFFAIGELLFGTSLVINSILGTLSALFAYLAFRNFFNEETARVALLFAALSPFFMFMVASFHSHVPALFLFSSILYLISRVRKSDSMSWELYTIGFVGGVFVATREYTSVLISLPLVINLLAQNPTLALRRILALVIGIAPPLALLLGYNYRLTGDPLLFPHLLADPGQVPWFGYKGHTIANGLHHLKDSFQLLNLNLLGWPFSLVFLLFVPVSRKTMTLMFCFCTLVAGYFANFWTDYSIGVRYYFESVLILLVFCALGFWRLHTYFEQLAHNYVLNKASLSWFVVVSCLFSIVVYLPNLITVYGNHYNGNVNTMVTRYAPELDSPSLIFSETVGGENGGYPSGFLANPLPLTATSTAAVIYARDLGARNKELIGVFPDRNYYRYRFDPTAARGFFYALDINGQVKDQAPLIFP
jgi:4-amino-4-deoxy-L-arabinose transferase-like glycosyltransferase